MRHSGWVRVVLPTIFSTPAQSPSTALQPVKGVKSLTAPLGA